MARNFFWAAKEQVKGGEFLVSWEQLCRPICSGGLGIKNFRLQGLALRVRWEWMLRTRQDKLWLGLPMAKDTEAREVFDSVVLIKVGDGAKVLFWRDRWMNGVSAQDIAPNLLALVRSENTMRQQTHGSGSHDTAQMV
jgi:hypothetical protein